MNPAIKRYLDEHGATYTPEALRKGLLDAGYDPAEVDAALSDWHAAEANVRGSEARRTFGRWALWLHVGALVAVFLLLVIMKGTANAGVALMGCAVLGVALVLGWVISSLIGRALLGGTGVTIALIVPAISALVLGGACLGLMNAAIPTPPSDGTVHLEIVAPATFDKSADAACYVGGGSAGVQVRSRDLGLLDGATVTLDLNWFPAGQGPAGGMDLFISIGPESSQARFYSIVADTQLTVDASADGRTGSVAFEGLAREPRGPDDTDLELTGTATWNCN